MAVGAAFEVFAIACGPGLRRLETKEVKDRVAALPLDAGAAV